MFDGPGQPAPVWFDRLPVITLKRDGLTDRIVVRYSELLSYQPMPAKSCHYSMKKHPLDFNGCSRTIFCLAAAVIFLFSRNAPAAQVIQTLPFYDSFDYNPAAGLANASSTVWETCYATSNIQVTNNNLTLTGFVPSAGNGAAGVTTKATRFAGTQFTSQTAADGKTVYFSFLYQIAAYPTTNGVIAFLDATNIGTSSSAPMPGTTALALLINHAGQVGINAGSPSVTGAQYEPSATPLNTTVLVVARYTFHTSPATDVVDLWINPNSANYGAASAPASDSWTNGTRSASARLGPKWCRRATCPVRPARLTQTCLAPLPLRSSPMESARRWSSCNPVI
jgi:hypothetical protein